MLYNDALELLLSGRNGNYVIVPKLRTTLEHGPNDAVVMRLVETDIITWHSDGRIVLNSGDWKTVTTKKRYNDYLPGPWCVYSEKRIWYVRFGGWDRGTTYTFADGMTLYPNGSVTGAQDAEQIKADRKLDAQIKRYARGFVDALFASEIGAPSGGDRVPARFEVAFHFLGLCALVIGQLIPESERYIPLGMTPF